MLSLENCRIDSKNLMSYIIVQITSEPVKRMVEKYNPLGRMLPWGVEHSRFSIDFQAKNCS